MKDNKELSAVRGAVTLKHVHKFYDMSASQSPLSEDGPVVVTRFQCGVRSKPVRLGHEPCEEPRGPGGGYAFRPRPTPQPRSQPAGTSPQPVRDARAQARGSSMDTLGKTDKLSAKPCPNCRSVRK